MKSINSLRAILSCGATLTLGACYTQTPISTYPPPVNTRVVANVTDSGVVAMANQLGPAAEEVEGVVAGTPGDAVSIQLTRVDFRGGSSVVWNRETVTFPRFALKGFTERRLDRKRSWMAAAGIGIGAFLAARAFQSLGADEPVDNEPNPQAILLLPLRGSR
jgi:hypothetical protein